MKYNKFVENIEGSDSKKKKKNNSTIYNEEWKNWKVTSDHPFDIFVNVTFSFTSENSETPTSIAKKRWTVKYIEKSLIDCSKEEL